MPRSRREFLRAAALSGAALGLDHRLLAKSAFVAPPTPAPKPMKLLILGGTGFLGPAIVHAALRRGHEMTLFNRGRSNPTMFSELEQLKGNRDPKIDEGLEPLKGREWDAVLDTSGYFPRITRASAGLLKDNVGQYLFISSISVYKDFAESGIREDYEVGSIDENAEEAITNTSYGPFKALCEQSVEAAFPGRATNVRPGLIVGPLDKTDRFTYWPLRVRAGGEILAPGEATDPVQYIDSRDLAEFCIRCLEEKTAGEFNLVGPRYPASIAELIYGCKAVSGGDASLTWVNNEFLQKEGLQPWGHLPVWAPGSGELAGLNTVSNAAAVKAGFHSRPLADTVRDTLRWWDTLPDQRRARVNAGMSRERETQALANWHKAAVQ